MSSFWLIKDYIFANDFFTFFSQVISKKRKKSCFFFKSEKNVKYVFWNTGQGHVPLHNFTAFWKTSSMTARETRGQARDQ